MNTHTPLVETVSGTIRGETLEGIDRFLGVPFAATTSGANRFRSPLQPPPWTGVRDAHDFGYQAPQVDPLMTVLVGNEGLASSEDCLTLNFWRPADRGQNRPVMVFMHGGGFYSGSASHPVIDGTQIAANGELIVVTIQYRLGILGLLSHPVLEDPKTGHCGNWAFQDQIAALQWVQDNIAEFGGDKDNVTIFGESAGGGAVSLHCISPVSRPLFCRAIIQSSGPFPASRTLHNHAAQTFFTSLDITPDIATLQSLSVERILAGQSEWVSEVTQGRSAPRPMVDGVLLPDWPDKCVATGMTDGIDIMTSYMRDEMYYLTLFQDAESVVSSRSAVIETLGALKPVGGELYDEYAAIREGRGEGISALDLWVALKTDQQIRVPAMDFLALHAGRGNRAWATCIDWQSSWKPEQLKGRSLQACHILDVPLIFGTYNASENLMRLVSGTGVERVSRSIQAAWIAFAKTGDPNCDCLPDWPGYDGDDRSTMMLGKEMFVEQDPRASERKVMTDYLKKHT